MSDAEERRKFVEESEEYQAMDSESRKVINGMMGLLEMNMIPPTEMAKTVMMAAVGTSLVDNEHFMKLADGGVFHVKGTNELAIMSGGWCFRLTPEIYDADDVDMNDLEPM